MTEIFDDTITDRPEDSPVLTVEMIDRIVARLKEGNYLMPITDIVLPVDDSYIPLPGDEP